MSSILDDVKKGLGIDPRYTHFDPDIKMHINSVFMILNQIGVGPVQVFSIDGDEGWDAFLGDKTDIESVKSYIILKVRLLFDPPQSTSTMESIKNLISELEFRLNVSEDSWPGVQNVSE